MHMRPADHTSHLCSCSAIAMQLIGKSHCARAHALIELAHVVLFLSCIQTLTPCKMGGFLDLRPWKLEGNMISNLIENLGKPASLLSFYKLSLETSRVLRFSLGFLSSFLQVSMDASTGNLILHSVSCI